LQNHGPPILQDGKRNRNPPLLRGRERNHKKLTDGDFKMLTKTKAVLAAALIFGTASAALAGSQGEDTGGYVLPGNTDGVNPVYHPDLFPATINSGNAGKAYGFVPAAKQTHRPSHEKTQDR
jgi:hypothetical protein